MKPFVLFGPSHLTTIALSILLPLALAALARPAWLKRAVRLAFAAVLLAAWALWYWLIESRGWLSAQTALPMHLCDWAAIATLATLLHPNQRSYELAYFWAFSGTLQALLTPELHYDFPDLRFVVFFAFHGGVIAAVLFLTLGQHMRPVRASLPRGALWTLAYAGTALATDAIFGVNFGYLRAKPATASLLDFLAPWPWYIGELVAIGVAFLFLLYAPFHFADRIAGSAQANPVAGR